MPRPTLLLTVALALTSLSLPAQTGPVLDPGADAVPALDVLYEGLARAYDTLDPELAGALYAEGARYLPPDRGPVVGREAITTVFADFFREAAIREHRLSIAFEILERRVEGTLAYDVGIYTLTRHDGHRRATSRGKFVTVSIRDADGAWRFQVDSYSALPPG